MMNIMTNYSIQNHNIQPIYDKNSTILILGSFPSVKSREGKFFYNHPQNRFWKVISNIYGYSVPSTIKDKINLLLSNNIALWDVIQSCEIVGSSDSSIRKVIPNDISNIVENSKIEKIFTNGNTAHKMYQKYIGKSIDIEEFVLPSTSPANARYSLDNLIEAWKVIKKTDR